MSKQFSVWGHQLAGDTSGAGAVRKTWKNSFQKRSGFSLRNVDVMILFWQSSLKYI